MTRGKGVRSQKKYCDFRCWNATGVFCSCWCGGMNHGTGRVPAGADPKIGFTEEEYEGMVSRDHAPTTTELQQLAKSGSNVRTSTRVVHPNSSNRVEPSRSY